jgi:hypothetical protein
MTTWPKAELRKIAETDELQVSPLREDGKTYSTPKPIWSVVIDDELYVRAYKGPQSKWYQAALKQKAGRITVAGITKEVAFDPADAALNDRVDDAYRAKYKRSPYLGPMIAAPVRSTTLKVTPRATKT